jgi:hypothetical protein
MRLYLFLLASLIANNAFTQGVSKCKKESIKLYNVKIPASEVTGQPCFSSNSHFYRTSILDPMIQVKVSEMTKTLGTYRSNYKQAETVDLFNLSFQPAVFPLLDSIDFDYYENVGFDKLPKEIKSSETYAKFKTEFKNATNTKTKKKVLFDDKFESIRKELLQSRYSLRADTFSVTQHKVSKSTASLRAKLDSIIISSGVTADAKLSAYLSRLADETVVIKGVYYEALLDPSYMAKLEYHIDAQKGVKLGTDQFARSLNRYMNLENAAVNTGLVAIGMIGTLNKKRIEATALASELQAQFSIPKSKAAEIAVSINYSFRRDLDKTINVAFNNVFTIRYFTALLIDDLTMLEEASTHSIFVNVK